MRTHDYHTIGTSNDNHMKLIHAERKPQNEPVKQDTPFTELMKFRIITLNTLIAIILSTVFNANILVIVYLAVSAIAIICFIAHAYFK